MATRRQANQPRRVFRSERVSISSAIHSRSHPPPLLAIALGFLVILVGAFIGYFFLWHGTLRHLKDVSRMEGDSSCTQEVVRAIPILKKAYGDSMQKVLHVGPDTCSVISRLIKEDGTEAWGVEPYDIEDADHSCKVLVRRGFVRVNNVKFPLPYREKSFSLVIVSDTLDYLSPKYLNMTLPEFVRLSSTGLVIFSGYQRHRKAISVGKSKFGTSAKLRSTAWWVRFFVQKSLEENEDVIKKFERAAENMSYNSNCQIFHLKSYSVVSE